MKVSNYNMIFDYNNDIKCIYNTLTRKYILCDNDKKSQISDLLENINKDKFTFEEVNILKKLASSGMIVNDNLDEFHKVSYLFNKTKYQENTFIIAVLPTLDCNFACKYCFEERKNIYWNDELINNLTELVKNVSAKAKNLQVSWFGGEPLLEYEKIKELTKTFIDICNKNNCEYYSTTTTNGYLFSDERINELEELRIRKIQITIDGDKEFHDKSRPLRNGNSTFDRIFNNFNKIADKDIAVILRINIDQNNKDSVSKLLDKVPYEKRKNIIVNICNIFQNEEKVEMYDLYHMALEKGFKFIGFRSDFALCEGSFINSITIEPDGRITPCQMSAEKGLYFGSLKDEGVIHIDNKSDFYKFRDLSPLDNEDCKQCNLLPMCLGGCPHKRFLSNNMRCDGKSIENMSYEEMIKLHIFYDIKNNFVTDENVV